MAVENVTDFGPLKELLGTWKGDKGLDIAPEPEGTEESPYFETITFEEVGEIKNAETQELVAIRYLQVVRRKLNGEVFHDETGYWIWDKKDNTIMLTFSIPRAVNVLATGSFTKTEKEIIIKVEAIKEKQDFSILQSPFMLQNAKTNSFTREFRISTDTLSYFQNVHLDIYGKTFEHTDKNELRRV
ncbi:MAG: FABP family protein [Leptospiraceae bacterium]|nr:FABP family protein [Leptospiraceae bacterium]MCP5502093.1 FABP family protein [Leptospiraceae bacterium]